MSETDSKATSLDTDAWLFAAIVLLALLPLAALGQEAPAGDPGASVERMKSGFVVAPEARFAEVDGDYGTLAGFHAGWSIDRTLLIGGAGYWLADGDGREMAYGGALVEWALRGDRRLGVSARTLIGGGSATFRSEAVPAILARHMGRFGRGPGTSPGFGVGRFFAARGIQDDFFVLEPQLGALWNIRSGVRLNAGVGYRLVAGDDWLEGRLGGVSGTLSLQIGGGF